MTERWFFILVLANVTVILACALWKHPVTAGGWFSLALCMINVLGWYAVALFPDQGHPPLSLFPSVFFWFFNILLLPTIGVSLWMLHIEKEERAAFITIASIYFALNVTVLYLLPLEIVVRQLIR
ncbi:MAG: hypothetical protein ABIP75_11825 [Pyrinomonadaceae bacterium]